MEVEPTFAIQNFAFQDIAFHLLAAHNTLRKNM